MCMGNRRGPAPEAQALYTDLSPPERRQNRTNHPLNPSFEGKGRPTKRNRRQRDLYHSLFDDTNSPDPLE